MNRSLTRSTSQLKKILNELTKYKTETKQLKQELSRLQTENKFKNKLLDEKSKHILSCNSENSSLRKVIESLKTKLQKKPRDVTFYKSAADQHEHEQNQQMPYLSSNTPSSNLSAQACKLSLPCHLKPIAESRQYKYTSPISPITPNLNASDNNHNIHIEWGECIAISDDDNLNNELNEEEEMDHLTLTTWSTTFASGNTYGNTNTNTSDNMNFVFVDYNPQIDIEADHEFAAAVNKYNIDPMLNKIIFLTDENEQNVIFSH